MQGAGRIFVTPESMSNRLFRTTSAFSAYAPYYRGYEPVFRETFGDISKWSAGAGAALAEEAQYFVIGGASKRGSGWEDDPGYGIRFTKTADDVDTVTIAQSLSAPVDLSQSHCLLRYYIHDGVKDTLNRVIIKLIDGDGRGGEFLDVGVNPPNLSPHFWHDGWRSRPFVRTQMYNVDAGFDLSDIEDIEISIKSEEVGDQPVISLEFLEFLPQLSTPIPYLVTFDGHYENQKEALAYLAARGIRADVYATHDNIGGSGRMTMEDLKQAGRMGHVIDVHERSASPTSFYLLTDAQKHQTLRESVQWRREHGFHEGGGYASLQGAWYSDHDDEFMELYLMHCRQGGLKNTVMWNPRVMGSSYDTNFLTVEDEAIARQFAIDNGLMYSGVVHHLEGEDFGVDEFKAIIDSAIDDPDIVFATAQDMVNKNWY